MTTSLAHLFFILCLVSISHSASADDPPPAINGVNLLHAASFQGHNELVTALLTKKTFSIDEPTPTGSRAIHVAAYNNHSEVVKTLITYGATIDVKDNSNFTPLLVAAQQGHPEIVRILLEAGADIEARNKASSTALHIAAIDGHKQVVELLLEKGANINVRDIEGVTPLHASVIKENEEIVELLLSKGALVNTLNRNQVSPLYSAIVKENIPILKILLKVPNIQINYKVDIESIVAPSSTTSSESKLPDLSGRKGEDSFDISNDKGSDEKKYITPLYKACNSKNLEMLDLLLSHGAKIGKPSITGGLTCLHKAALTGDTAALDIYVKHKVDLNRPEKHGYTPLHVAAQAFGNHEFINRLIKHGADVNTRSDTNITPLHLSLASGNIQNAAVLLQHGAKVTSMDNDEKIPYTILLENDGEKFSAEDMKLFKSNSVFKVAMTPLSYWKTSEMFVWLNSVGEKLVEFDRDEFSLVYHQLVSLLEQEQVDDVDEADDIDQFGASHSRIVEESASSVLKKLRTVLSDFQEKVNDPQKGLTDEQKKEKDSFYDLIRNFIKHLKNGFRNGPGFESFWKKAWDELEENFLVPRGIYQDHSKSTSSNSSTPSSTTSPPTSPTASTPGPSSSPLVDESKLKDIKSQILN